MIKKLQPFLAFTLLIGSISGLLWGLLPPAQEIITIPMQEVRLSFDQSERYATLMTPYDIQLGLPKTIKFGGKAPLSFTLNPTEDPFYPTATDVDLYEHFNVVIELRPEFNNLDIDPAGSMRTTVIDGQPVSTTWSLSGGSNENHTGIFWVYLTFYPLDSEQESQRTAILAKEIQFETQTFLGLNTDLTTILSAAGLTAAFLLGWPQVSQRLSPKPAKRKRR